MALKQWTVGIATIAVFISVTLGLPNPSSSSRQRCDPSATRYAVGILHSPRVTHWGSWGSWEYCPPCSHAIGFQIKVERDQGSADNTALNAIRLICSDSASTRISSREGEWGVWRFRKNCSGSRKLNSVELRIEDPLGRRRDNTAMNDMNFVCRGDGRQQTLNGNGAVWGSWYQALRCPTGSFICGLRTQVESNKGPNADNTALNNVNFACCN